MSAAIFTIWGGGAERGTSLSNLAYAKPSVMLGIEFRRHQDSGTDSVSLLMQANDSGFTQNVSSDYTQNTLGL